MVGFSDLFVYLFAAWMILTAGTYGWIRLYIRDCGEPLGWRFNTHGARAFPGHLSFYERNGGQAVVLRPVYLFPLIWKVKRTPYSGAYLNLETAAKGPVWDVVPWIYRWMGCQAVVNGGGGIYPRNE